MGKTKKAIKETLLMCLFFLFIIISVLSPMIIAVILDNIYYNLLAIITIPLCMFIIVRFLK